VKTYIVYNKAFPELRGEFKAKTATKARLAGYLSMSDAGWPVWYIDMRARLAHILKG
jgi:hypothetical protein